MIETAVRDGPPRRRRPVPGGQRRSAETRDRLIAAALEVFGEIGFAEATTRAIAAKAGVTLPVLAYHCGDKAGLYQACAEHIAARIGEHIGPALARVDEALARPGLTRGELVGLLARLLGAMANLLGSRREPEAWVGFIVREQARPTAAFDTLYDGIMGRVAGTCAAIVGRLLGRPADDPEVRLRALGWMGQVMMLRTGRAAVLRTMGWPDLGGERLEAFQAALRAQVEAAFRASPAGTGAGG